MGKRQSSSRKKIGIKVVYISSPMKVKTSASEFRATVQELTGRDSDVARIMDTTATTDSINEEPDNRNIQSDDSSSKLSIAHEEMSSVYHHYLNGNGNIGSGIAYHLAEDYNDIEKEWSRGGDQSESPVERLDGNLFSMPHVERSFRENAFPLVFKESALHC